MVIKYILSVALIATFCTLPAIGEEANQEAIPSLSNELNASLGEPQLKPFSDAEQGPVMNTRFWDLANDPNGQIIWPKTNGIGKELRDLRN